MRTYAVTQALQTALTENTYLWAQIKTITGATLTAANHVSIVTRDQLVDIIEIEPFNCYAHFYIQLPEIRPTRDYEHYTCNMHVLGYTIAVLFEESEAGMEYIQEITDYAINALKQSSTLLTAGEPVIFDGAEFYRAKPESNIISALIHLSVICSFTITS